MVEGRHFRRDWAERRGRRPPGRRAEPLRRQRDGRHRAHSLTIGLAAPADLPVQWALDFARGFAAECAAGRRQRGRGRPHPLRPARHRGDRARRSARSHPVLRSGAGPGDVLALTGRQGWAAGGLAVLGRGFRSPRVLVEAYRRPEPPYAAGQVAAEAGATSMIDISDGLLAEAGHLAEASGVAIDVRRGAFEIARAAAGRGRPRSAPTRCSSSSAAGTTTRCWRPSPTSRRCPRAGRSSARCSRGGRHGRRRRRTTAPPAGPTSDAARRPETATAPAGGGAFVVDLGQVSGRPCRPSGSRCRRSGAWACR